MKYILPILITFLIFNFTSTAQSVAINNDGSTADASAILDAKSTIKGMLIPRMTKAEKNLIAAPANGLIIFQTSPDSVGFHYYNGTIWVWMLDANNVNGTAWKTLGNSGTNATTNFIGTTDATGFVIKTSGSAATNERMRIGSGGKVTVNNIGAYGTDAFSVYGDNTTNGTTTSINNSVGISSINGYASGGGIGVYGESASAATTFGYGVWGQSAIATTAANSSSQGVYGANSSVPFNGTSTTYGVVGSATATSIGTGFTFGLAGFNSATAGNGGAIYGSAGGTGYPTIIGFQTNTTAIAIHAIQGQATGIGGAAGIRGFNTATAIGAGQAGYGVRGSVTSTPTGTGFTIGVRGGVTGTTGSSYGVYGDGTSSAGFAFAGLNNNTSGTGMLISGNNAAATYLTGGSGIATNGSSLGTFTYARTAATGTGILAVGNNNVNLLTLTVGSGVSGVGTQYGVAGFATTIVNTDGGNTPTTNGANGSAGGYFEVQNAGTPQTWAYVGVRDNTGTNRKIIGNGTVNTIVKDVNNKMVMLSAPEAPENLFQDYGQGKLINGKIHIDIDPVFAKNILVNDKHPLRVFIQLEGNSKGVYVANKTQYGFDVVELNDGQSNIDFTYTVIGNRANTINPDGTKANYAEERFATAPGPAKTEKLTTATAPLDIIQKQQDAPMPQAPALNLPSKNVKTIEQEEKIIEKKSLKSRKSKVCKAAAN